MIRLDRVRFLCADRFMQSLILRAAIQRILNKKKEIGYDHIDRVMDKISTGQRFKLDFPGAITIKSNAADGLTILRRSEFRSISFRDCLVIPGETVLSKIGWKFRCEIIESPVHSLACLQEKKSSVTALIDFDKIKGKMQVRNRLAGDRFMPLGLSGTKKLQDFFVDAKVPAEERDGIPLVCDLDSIIWVVGHRLSDQHKIDEKTHKILRIVAVRLEEET
jgi:tRNA(Ile)-lysidine synthase